MAYSPELEAILNELDSHLFQGGGHTGNFSWEFQSEPPPGDPIEIDLADVPELFGELAASTLYLSETDPARRAEYLREIIRHFQNRVKTDPSRANMQPCLDQQISDTVLHDGLQTMVQIGFELYDLGHSLLLRDPSGGSVIFGDYRGPGQNNGTVFQDGKPLPSKAKPISLEDADAKLADLVNGRCRQPVPVASTVTVPETLPTTAAPAEYSLPDLAPSLLPAAGVAMMGAAVLVLIGAARSRSRA